MSMIRIEAPLRLTVSVTHFGKQAEVRSETAQWLSEDAARSALGRAQAQISLDELSLAQEVSVAVEAVKDATDTFRGFVVLRSDGEDQICWSFVCSPRASQSLNMKLEAQVSLEIMVTSDVARPSKVASLQRDADPPEADASR